PGVTTPFMIPFSFYPPSFFILTFLSSAPGLHGPGAELFFWGKGAGQAMESPAPNAAAACRRRTENLKENAPDLTKMLRMAYNRTNCESKTGVMSNGESKQPLWQRQYFLPQRG